MEQGDCLKEYDKMKLYRMITGPDDAKFCHRVSAALSNGWMLSGSATLTFDSASGTVICGQAITKDVPDETYRDGIALSDY